MDMYIPLEPIFGHYTYSICIYSVYIPLEPLLLDTMMFVNFESRIVGYQKKVSHAVG